MIEFCERRFSTGINTSRIATAENAADCEIIVAAAMPYDFQFAL